jgi:hypothetical protein
MALQTSGAISLNNIHVEAGGSSGSAATINDSDIRDLISKGSGAAMSFNEWYGASNFPMFSPNSTTPFTIANLRIGPDSGGHGYYKIRDYESQGKDVFMSPNGLKLYITGSSGDGIDEFTLTTAWKVSTASHTNFRSFATAGRGLTPLVTGFSIKSNGTKLITVDVVNDDLCEYTLSTAWNISTMSFVRSYSIASVENLPTSVTLNSAGTKLYTASNQGNGIDQWTLNNAWQLSSVTHNGTWNAYYPGVGRNNNGAGIYTPQSIMLNSNGTKFYLAQSSGSRPDLFEFTTSSAYNISGLPTTTSSYNYRVPYNYMYDENYGSYGANDSVGMWTDGSRLVQTGGQHVTVEPLTGSAYDFRYMTLDDPRFHTYLLSHYFRSGGNFHFNANGSRLYYSSNYGKFGSHDTGGVGGNGTNNVYNNYCIQINMTEGFNLSTATIARAVDFESTTNSNMGVVVSADGTSMYFINHGNYTDGYIQAVDQYTLSTAWEINTASYTRRFNTGLGSVVDIEFSPDGTKMYALDNSNDTIYQYTLTTAWNVGTANTSVPTTLYSTSAKETSPYCFCLSPDGTKLLVGGTTGKGIDEFTLSTAYNISTASYVRFKEIRYTYTNNLPFVSFWASGIQYHTDGCIIYVADAIAGGLSLHGLLT